MTKQELLKIRDEKAESTDFELNGEIYSPSQSITYASYDDMENAFKQGFNAAVEILLPKIEGLSEAHRKVILGALDDARKVSGFALKEHGIEESGDE